ncbi:P22 phage major capsid protein family protein [Streptomyces sp. NPDC001941]|uniref:P22 phage major capsid protein family protein n=1 Tax=Streptomyces sp. NPDC001941 TaxID=3154659 RepID=UPI003327698F
MQATEKGILKPEKWAGQSLGLLADELLLAGLVSRDAGSNFTGAAGDTVNIKRPTKLKARGQSIDENRKGTAITEDRLAEWKISIKLTDEVYSAVKLTSAELTLDVENYGAQVISPQTSAVADDIEQRLAKTFDAVASVEKIDEAKIGTEEAGREVRRVMIQLRKKLNDEGVPAAGRNLVIGTEVEAAILGDDHLTKVNESGTGETLRNATIGNLYGFRIVVSQHVDPKRMVAYHPTAFMLVTRAPAIPSGGPVGSTSSFGGVALTVQKDYNPTSRSERSIINTFTGINEVKDIPKAAYKTLTGNETFEALEGKAKQIRAVAATIGAKAK